VEYRGLAKPVPEGVDFSDLPILIIAKIGTDTDSFSAPVSLFFLVSFFDWLAVDP
jgi:hypothetical protein